MIGIDTNVLVRYIVQDDPVQSALATRFLESSCSSEQPGQVCLIVLCELAWVLVRAYRYDRDTVGGVLERLLKTAEFVVEDSLLAWRALRAHQQGTAEFADYLIAHLHTRAGAEYTITFDRKAAQHPFFKLLKR